MGRCFGFIHYLNTTVTGEWDKPDMTCTKYIKTLSGETDDNSAASSLSHSDRWELGGGRKGNVKV